MMAAIQRYPAWSSARMGEKRDVSPAAAALLILFLFFQSPDELSFAVEVVDRQTDRQTGILGCLLGAHIRNWGTPFYIYNYVWVHALAGRIHERGTFAFVASLSALTGSHNIHRRQFKRNVVRWSHCCECWLWAARMTLGIVFRQQSMSFHVRFTLLREGSIDTLGDSPNFSHKSRHRSGQSSRQVIDETRLLSQWNQDHLLSFFLPAEASNDIRLGLLERPPPPQLPGKPEASTAN